MKTLTMPPPAADDKTENVHEVTWKLFKQGHAWGEGDVKQGALANFKAILRGKH